MANKPKSVSEGSFSGEADALINLQILVIDVSSKCSQDATEHMATTTTTKMNTESAVSGLTKGNCAEAGQLHHNKATRLLRLKG